MCCDYCCDRDDSNSKCSDCGDDDKDVLCEKCWTSFDPKANELKSLLKDLRLGIIKGHFRETISLSELTEILEKI